VTNASRYVSFRQVPTSSRGQSVGALGRACPHTAQTTRMAVLFQLSLQRMGCAMFDLDQFIADCRAALAADTSHKNVREVVACAVSDPAAILKGLGEPKRSEVQKLYHSSELTILNVIWAPHMTIMPHNHQMWAVIGIYTGREDNIFWRRVPGAHGGKLEAVGARALSTKDADPLGHNIIHSVTNPIARLTGAIHVYGGDFFGAERSEWDPETLEEGRYDVAKTMRMFEEANARYGAS
jgi:predicted metal-dependent enzyme (double-stranded beta helix superfamily)